MKKLYYSFFCLIALALISHGAKSQTTFNYTGTLQTYTVPAGVASISIEATGAEGAKGWETTIGTKGEPGLGAQMYGEFAVTPGQVLTIMVGQEGQQGQHVGGGGGGTFVWDDGTGTLLIAAGGGGGDEPGRAAVDPGDGRAGAGAG